MSREVVIDFTGTEPNQGGGGSDRVPQGDYVFDVQSVEQRQTNSGKPMFTAKLTIASGEYAGKRLMDNFVFPVTENDSPFGKQRFFAFMLALGMPVTAARFKVDLDRFTGLRGMASVRDQEMAARDNYPARIVSQVDMYQPLPGPNGATAAPAPVQQPAPAPVAAAPAPAAAPVMTMEAAPLAPAPAAANPGAEIDDLFK